MVNRGPIGQVLGARRRLALLSTHALCLILTIVWVSIPALASKRMNVGQLKQLLSSAQAEHRQDSQVAHQLGDVKLTERLSPWTLHQLLAASPGPKTTLALRYMADASVLLDPPASELPPLPPADLEAQKAILSRAVRYVVGTLPALPNLLATRVTRQLVDAAQSLGGPKTEQLGGLFLADSFRTPIAFRDGKETASPFQDDRPTERKEMKQIQMSDPADPESIHGLTSKGEFGPMLAIILLDSAKGKLNWARWEQGDGKPLAVFQFAVSRSVSHFNLNFLQGSQGAGLAYAPGQGLGSRSGRPHMAGPIDDGSATPVTKSVGYHGLLTVDPETGAVLRLTIEMDWRPGDTIERPAMVVEYGPVQIGDATYICPTHSIAMSVLADEYQLTPSNPVLTVKALHLNDVEFTEYRRFGSESTLRLAALPAEEKSGSDKPRPPAETVEVASVSPGPSAGPGPPSVPQPASQPLPLPAPPNPPAVSPLTPVPLAPATADTAAAPVESVPEFLVSPADGLPGLNLNAATAASPAGNMAEPSTFSLKLASRRVDLDLVVTDKHGRPIPDLSQSEIEVYDNGRKQQILNFRRAFATAPAAAQPSVPSVETFSNVDSPSTAAPEVLILLMDEAHVARADLLRARAQVLNFLNAASPNPQVAIYTIGPTGIRVVQEVTADRAAVLASLSRWTPSAFAGSRAQSQSRRNGPQIAPGNTPAETANGGAEQGLSGSEAADPELMQIGASPLRPALESMTALARHFAAIPGHKSLALISGDSALTELPDQSGDRGNARLEAALFHTREALSEAQISLYVADASAAPVGTMDASLQGRSPQLDPTSGAASDPNHSTLSALGADASRIQTDMIQTSRNIQTPVRQLAESTGGRAINKGADLKSTLESIGKEGPAVYQVGFDPDTTADGKFHTLEVKIPSRRDVKLRYRNSYLHGEAADTLQKRFQEALWNPRDATAIPVTAQVVPGSAGQTVKLHIGFHGLDLAKADDRWNGQLYVFVAQRDDAAQKAEVAGDTIRLSLKQTTYDASQPEGIPYEHELAAKFSLSSVRILVVDGKTGQMGSVTLPASAIRE